MIETFRHFSGNSRNKSNGAVKPTICRKFFRSDELHPNHTGAKLLGALISRSVCCALECERSQTPASPPRTIRPHTVVSVETVQPSVPETPRSTSSRILFVDAHAPPPPLDDMQHFPLLQGNEVKAGSGHPQRESCNLVSTELQTGYSEAVKSIVEPKKTERVSTQLKTSSPPKRKLKCKC